MYIPLHVHSHYSLLDGLSKCDTIAKRIEKIGVNSCAISDHGSLSGCVQFVKAMKKVGKKPILGCEFYVSPTDASIRDKENRHTNHLVVLAKNLQGWKQLIKMTSEANKPELFYHKPRLDKTLLAKYADGNLISFSGHLGSHMAEILFVEPKLAFNANTVEQAKGLLKTDWEAQGVALALEYQEIFGKGNFKIEIQLIDKDCLPSQIVVANCLRRISEITGIPCLATPDAHYAEQSDAIDQRILLCTNLGTTIANVERQMENNEDVMLGGFFRSTKYHIPSIEEMVALHTKEELENTVRVADECDEYDILGKPILPPFTCPNGQNEDEYLRYLCKEGWRKKIQDKIPKHEHQIYGDRVKHELEVLQGAGLSSYFLIVQDILNYGRSNGWLLGPGRGSVAGSLVAYLTSITAINPIPYNLIFERFYNDGRNTVDRVSMPDVDMDVPAGKREQIISYIKSKYGEDRVAQMVSFQTMKGRSALKDVLRTYGGISFEEMNRITEHIPDEAKIADELQEMREETGESSIIRWALENNVKELEPWCFIDTNGDGSLQGPLSKRFEQAIRLEGTKSGQSKHAAGIAIAPQPLGELCPMIMDKSNKTQVAGFEMYDLEDIGILKFDILGLSLLDKIMGVKQILETGDIQDEIIQAN